jgi:hypothetical protein
LLEKSSAVNNENLKRNTSIRLKAVFLLVVFGLNTIVGFACSLGVDMGFNSKHHEESQEAHNTNDDTLEPVVHIHKDGQRHIHYEKKKEHKHDKSHQHNQASNKQKQGQSKDNCCADKVNELQDIDSLVPNSLNISHPVFLTAFIASYYDIGLLSCTDVPKDIRQFVRNYHPPIPDIRIAIQSFQI